MSSNERVIDGQRQVRRFAYLNTQNHDHFGLLEAENWIEARRWLCGKFHIQATWLALADALNPEREREIVSSIFMDPKPESFIGHKELTTQPQPFYVILAGGYWEASDYAVSQGLPPSDMGSDRWRYANSVAQLRGLRGCTVKILPGFNNRHDRDEIRQCVEEMAARGYLQIEGETPKPLALDVSLEKARALHRVWRALNDGDCPNCHKFHAATDIIRNTGGIQCPTCDFRVTHTEINRIEQLFAPAMDAAVAIFRQWRAEGVTP